MLQLFEYDGRNGTDHSNHSSLEKEYKTQHETKLFLFTVEDYKCKMFTIRFPKLENLAMEHISDGITRSIL